MISLKRSLSFIIVFVTIHCSAQTPLPIAVNLQATYNKGTRTVAGSPGKNYWQNKADYTIKVNFNPQSRNLKGNVAIDYTNNSPDTLKTIVFKLYPNLFRKGSIHNMAIAPDDLSDGVKIRRLKVDKEEQNEKAWTIDGTNMTVNITPLLSKQTIHIEIDYSYVLNKNSHIRHWAGRFRSVFYRLLFSAHRRL